MIDSLFERWADRNAGYEATMEAAGDDPIKQLCALLKPSGARVDVDLGRSTALPCTFCGSKGDNDLVKIGRYGDGSSLERPVCTRCKPIAEARSKPRLREGWPS